MEVTTLEPGPMSQEVHHEAERAAANSAKLLRDLVALDFSQRLRTEEKAGVEAGVEVGREQMFKAQDGHPNPTSTTNTQMMVAHPKSILGATDFWLVLWE
jgi:hypothetical protein